MKALIKLVVLCFVSSLFSALAFASTAEQSGGNSTPVTEPRRVGEVNALCPDGSMAYLPGQTATFVAGKIRGLLKKKIHEERTVFLVCRDDNIVNVSRRPTFILRLPEYLNPKTVAVEQVVELNKMSKNSETGQIEVAYSIISTQGTTILLENLPLEIEGFGSNSVKILVGNIPPGIYRLGVGVGEKKSYLFEVQEGKVGELHASTN